MWHASTAHASKHTLKRAAENALLNVGDPSRGEWHEWSGKAYHIRRRLNAEEDLLVGPVEDIRGTVEATMRLMPVRRMLPANWPEYRIGG